MSGSASLLLLFVAAGLLLLAGVGIGRWRGRPPSTTESAVMASMTGIAISFLFTVMPVIPIVVFPFAIAGILVVKWTRERAWQQLGAFLVGGGGLVFGMQLLSRVNDLADPAVTVPGWTPIPMAVGAALSILGVTLVTLRSPRGEPEC